VPESPPFKIALCLLGGGATGAMYQVGALAALEDTIEGFQAHELGLYVGSNSGASVAAVLAGGRPIQRLYRALLDPADVYFGLERKHLLRIDAIEYRRVLRSAFGAVRHGVISIFDNPTAPMPSALSEELERLYDSLPAGLFTLDVYERFLEDFFVRRGVPNSFGAMPRDLRILAHDLDTGERVIFGGDGRAPDGARENDHVTVTRACIASMAVPPFFSPVRIGDRQFVDPGAASIHHLEVARDEGSNMALVVNPLVPVRAAQVPTGHGPRSSLRDKGMLWVVNQVIRVGVDAMLDHSAARVGIPILRLQPDPADQEVYMLNPSSFAARRRILEHSYRSTRACVLRWFEEDHEALRLAGFRLTNGDGGPRSSPRGSSVPPASNGNGPGSGR
jgi:NTE family protein